MLPNIGEAVVVSAQTPDVQPLGYWCKGDGDVEALLRFAQLAANSASERFIRRGERDLFALPLHCPQSKEAGANPETDYVVVATDHLADDRARSTLVKFLKAGVTWYRLLKRYSTPANISHDGVAQLTTLCQEFMATKPFKAACVLLVSRLAKQFGGGQLALVYQPAQFAKAGVVAVSDTANLWAKTEAAQALIQQAQPHIDGVYQSEDERQSGTTLAAMDHNGGVWLLSLANPDTTGQWPAFAALWPMLVPLLGQRYESQLGPWARLQNQFKKPLVSQWRWLVAALLVAFLCVPMRYHVSAPAALEGITQRAVVAPEDGFVRSSFFRAGDKVSEGDLIAQLDDDELKLERKQLLNELAELERQYRQALVDSDLSQSRVVKSQLAQSQAELDIIDHRLGRTQLIAPFAGVIIEGDLTRSEGAPVEKGQVLFEIAPAGQYRLVLNVDERNMAALADDAQGTLYLNSQPGQGIGFQITRIGSVAKDQASGPQRYRVEALLQNLPVGASLQPGMQGVAKVAAGRRSLLWVLLHRPWHWLLFKWWAIAP